jgi:hypothetical protein
MTGFDWKMDGVSSRNAVPNAMLAPSSAIMMALSRRLSCGCCVMGPMAMPVATPVIDMPKLIQPQVLSLSHGMTVDSTDTQQPNTPCNRPDDRTRNTKLRSEQATRTLRRKPGIITGVPSASRRTRPAVLSLIWAAAAEGKKRGFSGK